jgi:DNA-binding LacI/PurR family transcriptional regulator
MSTSTLEKVPTIGDVARLAGVSRSTASAALNGKSGKYSVAAGKREAILRAAQKIGYSPNPHAQRLAIGRCENTIALVTPYIHHGTGAERAHLIQEQLRRLGYFMPIHTYGMRDYHNENEAGLLEEVCRQSPRALLHQSGETNLDEDAMRVLTRYQEQGGEVLCFLVPTTLNCDHVLYDYHDAAYQAARHLIELGHRKIGYYRAGTKQMYLPGFFRALKEAKIEAKPEWLFFGPAQQNGGEPLARQYLALAQKPTALVVENDATATMAVNFLLRAGIKVPEDVSLVGFDDTIMASSCIVPLTAIRQPVENIARMVVELLLERLQDGYNGAPRRVVIRGEVVARESTVETRPGASLP